MSKASKEARNRSLWHQASKEASNRSLVKLVKKLVTALYGI